MNSCKTFIISLFVILAYMPMGLVYGSPEEEQQHIVELREDILGLRNEPWLERSGAILDFMSRADKKDYSLIFEILSAEPSTPFIQRFWRYFTLYWAEVEPQAALAFAHADESDERPDLISYTIMGWAKLDPVSAWSELMSVSNFGANKKYNIEGVLRTIAQTDLNLAMELYQDLSADKACLSCASSFILMEALEYNRIDELRGMLDSMEEGVAKERFWEEYWEIRGYFEHESALSDLNGVLDEKERKSALLGLLRGWSRMEPMKSLEYVYANVSGDELNNFIPYIVNEWAKGDFLEEITVFLENLPKDNMNDRSIVGIVNSLAVIDPVATVAWVETIENEDLRKECLEKLIWRWARFDPDAAKSYTINYQDSYIQNSLVWYCLLSSLFNKTFNSEDLEMVELRTNKDAKFHLLQKIALIVADPSKNDTDYVDRDALAGFIMSRDYLEPQEQASLIAILDK